MAAQFRSTTTPVAGSTATWTVAAPSGATPGDLIVAFFQINVDTPTVSRAGWTVGPLISDAVNAQALRTMWHVFVAGETTYAFTMSVSTTGTLWASRYDGVNPLAPIGVSTGRVSNASLTTTTNWNAVSPTNVDDLLVLAVGDTVNSGSATSYGTPATTTGRITTTGIGDGLFDKALSSSGTTGAFTSTCTSGLPVTVTFTLVSSTPTVPIVYTHGGWPAQLRSPNRTALTHRPHNAFTGVNDDDLTFATTEEFYGVGTQIEPLVAPHAQWPDNPLRRTTRTALQQRSHNSDTGVAENDLLSDPTGSLAEFFGVWNRAATVAAMVATSTRTVPTTIATIQTSARTVPTTVAALQTSVRTVPATLAALLTTTRTVPATIAALATSTRTVPTTVAAIASLVRTVPTTIATIATLTRTVPATIATLQTSVRTVPTTLAALQPTVRTVPTTLAALQTSTRTVPTTIAVTALARIVPTSIATLQTSVRTVPSTLAAVATVVRTVPSTVVAIVSSTRTVPTTLATLSVASRAIPTSAAVLVTATRTVPTTIATSVSGAASRTVPTTIAVISAQVHTVPTSVAVIALGVVRTVPSSVAALKVSTRSIPTTIPTLITGTRTVPTSLAAKATLARLVVTALSALSIQHRTVPTSIAAGSTLFTFPGSVGTRDNSLGTVGIKDIVRATTGLRDSPLGTVGSKDKAG
jgi:hypothetical protein